MYQLTIPQRSVLQPLFAGAQDSILSSCFAGWFGEAYADHLQAPKIGGIFVADFGMVAGDAFHAKAPTLLDCVPTDRMCILIPHEKLWETTIETHFGTRAKRIERYATLKEGNVFDCAHLQVLVDSLPPEYTLVPLDQNWFNVVLQMDWSHDFCSNFNNATDYAVRGLGVLALYQGVPVGGASSYTSYPGGIEIEIDTQRAHRQKGIASACGAMLILRSLARGLYPNWDAMTLTSLHLAEKLGYHFSHAYPAYVIQKQGE